MPQTAKLTKFRLLRMPRVLVDLLSYSGTKGGMEVYTRELYRRLGDLAPGWEFIGFFSREGYQSGPVMVPRPSDRLRHQR